MLEAGPRRRGHPTERFDGWVVDGGPDSILVQKPAAVALCRELGIADRLVSTLPPRTAYILRDDRLHRIAEGSFLGFPLDARSLARSSVFSLGGRLRMAGELFMPRGGGDEDESIGTFVRRRFGQEAVDYLAEPLLAGIHAGDVDRLSTQALFPRLLEAERQSGSVLRAFRACARALATRRVRVVSRRRRASSSMRWSSARHQAPCASRRGSPTFTANANYRAETPAGRSGARVILAVPAYVAASLLRVSTRPSPRSPRRSPTRPPPRWRWDIAAIRSRTRWKGSGFVVPRVERSPLLAATWVTSNGRIAPRTGTSCCAASSAAAAIRGGWMPTTTSSSAWWSRNCAADGDHGAPLFTRLFRWTKQSPQYEVGHLQRVATIERQLASDPRPVRHRQRLPRDRHSRLHRRRPGHRRARRGVRGLGTTKR